MIWKNHRGSHWIAALLALTLAFGTAQAQEPIPTIETLTTTEAYDPIRYASAFIIADAWREPGFDVIVRPQEFSSLLARFFDEQNFDVTILGRSGRVERLDPEHFLATLDSRQSSLGSNNPGGYDNPAYDALFDAQSREFGAEARRASVQEMQEIAAPDAPLVVLYHRDEIIAYNATRWTDMVTMAGEDLYNERTPLRAAPLTEARILTIGSPLEPDNLNPLASASVWGWKWLRLFYDKLVRLSPEIEPLPWMAESITPVNDVTIDTTVRSGMTFHDSTPVTADDVKFTFDYYVEKDFGNYFVDLGRDVQDEIITRNAQGG